MNQIIVFGIVFLIGFNAGYLFYRFLDKRMKHREIILWRDYLCKGDQIIFTFDNEQFKGKITDFDPEDRILSVKLRSQEGFLYTERHFPIDQIFPYKTANWY